MSVLKSIMHHWNSTSKAYDTLHPETEVGQITDFGKGLLNQLAATTAQSVISALQTGSWFGQLLKLVLNASGVKYSIATNGYVCLGSFFGGLIIQWGQADFAGQVYLDTAYPIKFSQEPSVVLTTDITGNSYQKQTVSSIHWGKNAREDALHLLASSSNLGAVCWLAVGF